MAPDVIFNYPSEFPADECERLVPDAATARRLVNERRPELQALLAQRRARFAPITGGIQPATLGAAEDAIRIAFCRLAYRHGSWGKDYHHYHNENHIFEILGARLERMLDAVGMESLDVLDWFLLALFGAAHDLRQREIPQFAAGIGSNERASIEETFRILDISGFSREDHATVYLGIELMIAGSTFDARPAPPAEEYNSAEMVMQSGGALAQKLDDKLDKHAPGWRDDPRMVHALELALVAADLDTANVAEAFPIFMASTERLSLEREMRSRRNPDSPESAQPILNFLTTGQEHYFFELHRFSSGPGRKAFAEAKLENVPRVRRMAQRMRESTQSPRNGTEVIETFRAVVAGID